MTINFTIGLNVVEFLCHFGAMIFYVRAGLLDRDKEENMFVFYILLFLGITLTTIGAHL